MEEQMMDYYQLDLIVEVESTLEGLKLLYDDLKKELEVLDNECTPDDLKRIEEKISIMESDVDENQLQGYSDIITSLMIELKDPENLTQENIENINDLKHLWFDVSHM